MNEQRTERMIADKTKKFNRFPTIFREWIDGFYACFVSIRDSNPCCSSLINTFIIRLYGIIQDCPSEIANWLSLAQEFKPSDGFKQAFEKDGGDYENLMRISASVEKTLGQLLAEMKALVGDLNRDERIAVAYFRTTACHPFPDSFLLKESKKAGWDTRKIFGEDIQIEEIDNVIDTVVSRFDTDSSFARHIAKKLSVRIDSIKALSDALPIEKTA